MKPDDFKGRNLRKLVTHTALLLNKLDRTTRHFNTHISAAGSALFANICLRLQLIEV